MTCQPGHCRCVSPDTCESLLSEYTYRSDEDGYVLCADCDHVPSECECDHHCGIVSDDQAEAEAEDERAYRRLVCLAAFGSTY